MLPPKMAMMKISALFRPAMDAPDHDPRQPC